MMEYVRGQGWVYVKPRYTADELQVGDLITKAFDGGKPADWGRYPYRVGPPGSDDYPIEFWKRRYKYGWTFEVTRDV